MTVIFADIEFSQIDRASLIEIVIESAKQG
jgi:hypothetical protein